MQGWSSPHLLFLLLGACSCAWLNNVYHDQEALPVNRQQHGADIISFGDWHVIGPFRIEAVWGADPPGAFQDEKREAYPSPLAPNATVRWESRQFDSSFDGRTGIVNVELAYEAINWEFLRSIYGWAALQYQAWAKSEIHYAGDEPVSVLLYPTNILELRWNNQTIFGGGFFGFERVPIVLRLNPGSNTIQVRLIRNGRANGGWGIPTIDATLRLSLLSQENAVMVPNSVILPDIVNGKPASSPASITICNVGSKIITVSGIIDDSGHGLQLLNLDTDIMPGQSRSIGFSLYGLEDLSIPTAIVVQYHELETTIRYELRATLHFTYHLIFSPHKITFMHFGGSVSYAILRPPPQSLYHDHGYELPVMVNLHGAGLDVNSPQVRHSFDGAIDLPCWMLFPTGMSPWSGDDWHVWGMMDIYAALEATNEWQYRYGWEGPGMLQNGLIIVGHSNGAQGAWQFVMHHPDLIIAAVMASGYTSIQNYVPYTMWTDAEPQQGAIIETALSSYKHELFIDNLKRTPVFVQHGSDDDNVPVYHSRLMNTLAEQIGVNITFTELQGKGHWFDGAMTTEPLLNFYTEFCVPTARPPRIPSEFSFVVPVSDDMSTKYGIMIDQLKTPDRLGRIMVASEIRDDGTLLWRMKTTNVHRLRFDFDQEMPDAVQLDDCPVAIEFNGDFVVSTSFVSIGDGRWTTELYFWSRSLDQRSGPQRGAMDSILRTQGPFQIVCTFGSPEAYDVAIQVARNLLQYFGADAVIRTTSTRNIRLVT